MDWFGRKENQRRSIFGAFQKLIFKFSRIGGVAILSVCLAIFVVIAWYMWQANQFDLEKVKACSKGITTLDCQQNQIGDLFGDNFIYVERKNFPSHLIEALLAREDEDFYSHNGVNMSSLFRATWRNLKDVNYTQGGSTLTMQLCRNAFALRDKSLHRKLLEVAISRRIEQEYKKEEILEYYLNRVYFGQGCYGIGAAAKYYFGTTVDKLTLNQSALLIGILRGPSIFNPIKNEELAIKQRNETLERMFECEYISESTLKSEQEKPWGGRKNPHENLSYATSFLRAELERIIEKNDIRETGILVTTSLDLKFQQDMEKGIEQGIISIENNEKWKGGKRNDTTGKKLPILQATAIYLNPKDGTIKAVLSGRDPIDGKDRWLKLKRPLGNLFAPLIHTALSLESRNVIARKPVQCGRLVGQEKIENLTDKLGWGKLPSGDDLFSGNFEQPLIEIVRLLLLMTNAGEDISLHGILSIQDNALTNFYQPSFSSKKLLPADAIRVSAKIWPFHVEGNKITITEKLPNGAGYFIAYIERNNAIFAWIGFEENMPDWKILGAGMESCISKFAKEIPECILNYEVYSARKKKEADEKRAIELKALEEQRKRIHGNKTKPNHS